MEWFTAVAIFLFLVLLYFFQAWILVGKQNAPPSPWKLPILGNLHHLMIHRKPLPVLFDQLSKRIGPIFTFWFGWSGIVIINDYELLVEAMKSENFSDRPKRHHSSFISRNYSGIIMTDHGTDLAHRKALGMQAFRDKSQVEQIIQSECEYLVDSIHDKLQGCNKKTIILDDMSKLATINIIWRLVFSHRFASVRDHEFCRIQYMSKLLLKGLLTSNLVQGFPFLAYLPLNFVKSLETFGEIRDDILSREYRSHVDTLAQGSEARDLFDRLLKVLSNSKEELTRDNLEIITFDMYLTGFETISTALRWTYLFLMLYPDVQQKCYEELCTVIGSNKPELSHMEHMPYTRATISESLRKGVVAPLSVPHKARNGGYVGNTYIPKGSTVLLNIYASHFDERYFPNAHSFVPERFIDENGKFDMNKDGFLAFSKGPRKCLGQAIAQKELFLFVANILQKFKLSCPPGKTIPETGIYSSTFTPADYDIVFERREST